MNTSEKESKKIDIDDLLVVGAELISDKPATTTAGRILRWFKKIIKVKTMLNIKIK